MQYVNHKWVSEYPKKESLSGGELFIGSLIAGYVAKKYIDKKIATINNPNAMPRMSSAEYRRTARGPGPHRPHPDNRGVAVPVTETEVQKLVAERDARWAARWAKEAVVKRTLFESVLRWTGIVFGLTFVIFGLMILGMLNVSFGVI